MSIRVIVADDDAILREGLRSLLETRVGCDVVGEADNGRAAVELACKLRPDLVLMDVRMRGLNGIEATRRILNDVPSARILGLSMDCDMRSVTRMLEAGAMGYVVKGCDLDELRKAIATVMADCFYVSERVADAVPAGSDRFENMRGHSIEALTPREREVLQLLAEGNSTKEIATALGLREKTVENHRRQLREKLEINSTAELTKYAIRTGLTCIEY
jgi:DNA-binding NarL/FixJ family response regulator